MSNRSPKKHIENPSHAPHVTSLSLQIAHSAFRCVTLTICFFTQKKLRTKMAGEGEVASMDVESIRGELDSLQRERRVAELRLRELDAKRRVAAPTRGG